MCVLAAGVGCESKPAPSGGGGGGGTPAGGSGSETDNGGSEAGGEDDGGESAAATTGGWGTVTGRFVYDGDPPAQDLIKVTKDIEFCTMKNPLKEELVVDPDSKGIANIVLMLYTSRGESPPEPHESYGDPASNMIHMDNEWCRFTPHVQFVQAGETVVFGNKDEVGHNVKGDPFSNQSFNQTIAAGGTLEVEMQEAERLPVKVTCTIHPWMEGWMVVQDHPYVAISGEDGSFELKNVPSGSWEFTVWQEQPGYLKELKIGGKSEKLSRGRWTVNVMDESAEGNAEKNALGDIMVPPSNF